MLNKWTVEEKNDFSSQIEKSLMMRYLIHVVGDVHQPLHGACRFSDKYPKGDEGGNLCKIKFTDNINNLHKLYDSCIGRVAEFERVNIIKKAFKRKFN